MGQATGQPALAEDAQTAAVLEYACSLQKNGWVDRDTAWGDF